MPVLSVNQTVLNRFHIEAFDAVTPLGEQYRALDERGGKYVALTVLPKSVFNNAEALKQIGFYALQTQNVSHPNVNKSLGLHKTPDFAFLLEDWIDGPSLKDVRAKGRLGAREALCVVRAVCGALEALHQKNFLHLHLAPEYVRINRNGEVILCGISGANSESKLVKYPPLYQAPEQIRGETPTAAADIYALAVLLYELTTGVWINGSFPPRTIDAIRAAQLDDLPPPPSTFNRDLPDHFSRMILWALRKDSAERFKTTTELLSSLTLASQLSPTELPTRANLESTPVIASALNAWNFLPPPKNIAVSADARPLEERLATLAAPTLKPVRKIKVVPILILSLVVGFFALLFFIRPAEEIAPLPTPILFTSVASNYTPPPTPSVTPRPTLTHGGRIAFTCQRGDYNQICVVNADGSDLAQLTNLEASNYYPVFSPDATSLLFASNRAGMNFDFFVLDFAKRESSQLTTNVGNVIAPDYSPDGRYIVFPNRVGDGRVALWIVNTDGLNPHLLYTGAGDIVSAAWSPDGERIAYAMNTGAPQEYEIFTMDADGRNHLKISQGLQGIGGSVDWSPDGASLLIHAGPFGDKDIFTINVADGSYAQLTRGGNNAGASYSPNGQYIVFNSLRNNDQADLFIMKADGSALRQITNNPEPDWGASWIE
ncbi:MAG: protein kinase [Anaerolineales bacterium]|nr:protein kinase [Anaerolineales bacterium]